MEKNSITGFILTCLKALIITGLFFVGIIEAINFSLSPYILKMMLNKLPQIKPENAINELLPLTIFYLSISLFLVFYIGLMICLAKTQSAIKTTYWSCLNGYNNGSFVGIISQSLRWQFSQ